MTMPFRLSAVAGLIFLGAMANAGAETTTDRYGKELKIEPTRNIFARFGLLGLKMNNKSEAAKNVSGPILSSPAVISGTLDPKVITPGDRGWYCSQQVDGNGDDLPLCDPAGGNGAIDTLYNSPTNLGILYGRTTGEDSLDIPDDIKARIADPAPGAIGTLGMYLDEKHRWAVEVPVMALPFDVNIYGAGTFQNAGKIATGKTLGFLVFGHYYFGNKSDKFRPSVSLVANYLIPFDLKSTPELERWTGGVTKISSKGSVGLGWLVGGKYSFNDTWDLNLHLGQFKAKVENTLSVYDMSLTRNSPIFTYWPGPQGDRLRSIQAPGGILDTQLRGIRAYRNYDPANRVNGGANLGNYVFKQNQTLDPYVMMVSVGYNF
ncbi:MAG: OmpW family outer membrane protein [Aquabacterium sp.]|uniref:OmpW family outer membrane protein n=1 Tax=Aquabacterium sp. TaxID=1872578 RepID=UPI00271E4D5A|nr:OmpW family outer membrane protein [Aquabacterium sp.]MDO9004699.1 OmpW family outer membrane protein [Aquabacterium sp.]